MSDPQPSATLILADQQIDPKHHLERGRRLAGGLRKLGCEPGDTIAVLLRNCLQYVDVIHACRIAGIAYCPINWHFTASEINFLLQDSEASLLITSQSLLDNLEGKLASSPPRWIVDARDDRADYETWLAEQPEYDGPLVAPRGHMAYTSGTTGRPKGVVRFAPPVDEVEHQRAASRALVRAAFGIQPGSRTLLTAPIYHSGPSVYLQNALLMSDLVVVMQRFDAEHFLQLVERHRIDTAYLVPIMYTRLLRLPAAVRARYDLTSLRFIASTGSPCPPEIKRQMIEWMGPVINETYASSEAGLITYMDAQDALTHPGSAGRPLLDARVEILDDDCQPLATGEIGRIFVNQPAYPDFTYKNNDQGRARIAHDGMITLGDRGYLDEDGYLYVCDRDADMVISGGVNIYPAEIENALRSHPQVLDCAVIGVPDDEFGEALLAMVETSPDGPLTAADLTEWMKGKLAPYKQPRQFRFCSIPRDDNGKISKARLRSGYWESRQRKV